PPGRDQPDRRRAAPRAAGWPRRTRAGHGRERALGTEPTARPRRQRMSASKSGSLAGLRQRGRQHRGILTLLAVLGCAALALPWAIDRWTHVWVTDSRIAADLVTVSSETSGRILR